VTDLDVEQLAELLHLLRPAPAAWLAAATELPRARLELDEIVTRARADHQFRLALTADLESALAAAGYTPGPRLLHLLRERLSQLQ
jgi:hypothetical protein